MKRVRSLVFWLHLAAGVTAGIVILVMAVTGALLALKPQILNAVERDVRFVAPPVGASRRGVQAIVASALTARLAPGRRRWRCRPIRRLRQRVRRPRRYPLPGPVLGPRPRRGLAPRAGVVPRRRRLAPLARGLH